MEKKNANKKKHPVLAIVLIVIVLMVTVLLLSSIESEEEPSTLEQPTETAELELSFSGNGYSAVYNGCTSVPGVDGAFYVTLDIENKTDDEQIYSLKNVYVDGYHCQSGSGLPITALGGKHVSGAFIIFTDADLDSVKEIEFQLFVMDENLNEISTSDTITVTP